MLLCLRLLFLCLTAADVVMLNWRGKTAEKKLLRRKYKDWPDSEHRIPLCSTFQGRSRTNVAIFTRRSFSSFFVFSRSVSSVFAVFAVCSSFLFLALLLLHVKLLEWDGSEMQETNRRLRQGEIIEWRNNVTLFLV